MPKSKIALVQWGRKGGGPKLALHLAQQILIMDQDVMISISAQNELKESALERFGPKVSVVQIGSKWSLLSPFKFLRARASLKQLIDIEKPDLVVFVMPHPWDLALQVNSPKIRIIHDAKRHPGDSIWPSNGALKRRILCREQLVVLSASVAEQVKALGGHALVSSHPIFDFNPTSQEHVIANDVLVIGRQRKYKGTENLLDIWPLVLKQLPEVKLVIAGEGFIDPKLSRLKNTQVINRWLSESEIHQLLSGSACVLFAYIEASQSGLLPAAVKAGAEVVVTPVGGLIEQAKNFGGEIAKSNDPRDIAASIITVLKRQKFEKEKVAQESSEEDLAHLLVRMAQNRGA